MIFDHMNPLLILGLLVPFSIVWISILSYVCKIVDCKIDSRTSALIVCLLGSGIVFFGTLPMWGFLIYYGATH